MGQVRNWGSNAQGLLVNRQFYAPIPYIGNFMLGKGLFSVVKGPRHTSEKQHNTSWAVVMVNASGSPNRRKKEQKEKTTLLFSERLICISVSIIT